MFQERERERERGGGGGRERERERGRWRERADNSSAMTNLRPAALGPPEDHRHSLTVGS